MRIAERLGKLVVVGASFLLAGLFAWNFGSGSLWRGFEPALAVSNAHAARRPYDLTRLEAVNKTLEMIRDKYVEPDRVKPRRMLLSALNNIQREVAQVIVQAADDKHVIVRVDTEERKFRIDNVQGPWDVSARLREVFAFLQKHLEGTEVDLRDVEYAACNGMLRTLDPHSVFLSPEAYREMNVQTSGAFGGLGIVISIRDQLLTVMKPMPGTPAGRAGLQRLDRIMKINNESTLNMSLDAAVGRLRGDAGTEVTVWIKREGEGGWQGQKPFVLTREQIKVASVISKQLEGSVGYVRLEGFQATTTQELVSALDGFRKSGPIRGLVIDLRGNPGGLLDQAARVSDTFLSEGVIVSTVGGKEARDEKRAHGSGTEPHYPIVVLVDGSSASASEIVAGALKNHDRAIIVGQQSFGKGSVQLVFPDITPQKEALKLTIAQYLTPGDVSIQGVGIVPDIELDPMTVDELEMDLTIARSGLKERDLDASLDNSRTTNERPSEVVRYQFTSKDRQKLRDGDNEEEFREDFPIDFGRKLVEQLSAKDSRSEQLNGARKFVEKTRQDELAKISKELDRLGVDWSPAPETSAKAAAGDLEVTIETDRAGANVTAGQPMKLLVTVKNKGKQSVYRLRGVTESANPYFDKKELVFGMIPPGESKTATAALGWCEVEGRRVGSTKPRSAGAKRSCKIPTDALSRSDGLSVLFDADRGVAPPPAEIRPTVSALERPQFEYAYQISDDRGGNGDGAIQRGEKVSMYLTVRNVGKGRSFDTQANISNLSGVGLLLRNGRFDISNMKPGDTRRVTFTFDVSPQLAENDAVLTLTVGDRDLRETASEKVRIPIARATAVEKMTEVKKARADARLLSAPKAARGFGRLKKGTLTSIIGKVGAFYKVKVSAGRYAFIEASALEAGQGAPSLPLGFDDVYAHAPPQLDVVAVAMSTKEDTIRLTGVASDGERLLDVYVYVGARKLFYQSNRNGSDPLRAKLEYDVPLRPGVNVINIVARENADTLTRRVLIVRRDGADGSILKSPKLDDPIEDWLGHAP